MAGSWTTSANTPPDDVATMLPLTDGTVMARGYGTSAWYRLTPSAMSYANGTWSTLASSTGAPLYYASGVLRDRRVIYSGGEYDSFSMVFLATSEIYDLIANTWTVILPLCLRLRRGCDMRGEGRDGLGTRGRGARAPRARRALMSTTRATMPLSRPGALGSRGGRVCALCLRLQRPTMADYVVVTRPTDEATAAEGTNVAHALHRRVP